MPRVMVYTRLHLAMACAAGLPSLHHHPMYSRVCILPLLSPARFLSKPPARYEAWAAGYYSLPNQAAADVSLNPARLHVAMPGGGTSGKPDDVAQSRLLILHSAWEHHGTCTPDVSSCTLEKTAADTTCLQR